MRREDWPERLMQTIERHNRMPFAWGVSDCYLLPIDCVVAMTGRDPCPELRGTYSTAAGAAKQLLARGFRDVAEGFASAFTEIPVVQAGRGDIGVVALPEGGFGGIVFAGTVAIGKDAAGTGNRRVPRGLVTRAFRVD